MDFEFLFGKMNWIKISLILCVIGFTKEFRPGEPFVSDYLTEYKNITDKQLTQEIYPIGTYSYLATLIIMFLLTDFSRYKPIIVLCGLSGTVTYCVLTFAKGLTAMKFVQFGYGLYLSTEVAYFTYIYAKVDKEHYQKVSGYDRSAILLGKFLAGHVLATIWAFFLPSVRESIYFHPRLDMLENGIGKNTNCDDSSSQENIVLDKIEDVKNRKSTNVVSRQLTLKQKIQRAYYLLWKDFLKAYTNLHLVKWSLWWAAATCGYLQVISYIQPLWRTAVKKDEIIYNGAVEATYAIIGAVTVFSIGSLKLNWSLIGEAFISFFTIIEAILLYIISQNFNIYILYILYIIFGVIYHTIVTVASFEVAKKISNDSYGLVFGINTTMSLAIQSLLTYVITSGNIFELDIRKQFVVLAGYFGVLAILFVGMAVLTISKAYVSGEELKILVGPNNRINANEEKVT